MRTLWIVLGGLAAAAGIVYVVRSRRREVEGAQEPPFDIVEAELIEVEAVPVPEAAARY